MDGKGICIMYLLFINYMFDIKQYKRDNQAKILICILVFQRAVECRPMLEHITTEPSIVIWTIIE